MSIHNELERAATSKERMIMMKSIFNTSFNNFASDWLDFSSRYFLSKKINFMMNFGRQKIIFVNGYLGFGSPTGGAVYWNGMDGLFVKDAKNYFGTINTYFTNVKYDLLSTAKERIQIGKWYAKEHYAEIISGLDKETSRMVFVTHSMGAALGEGMIELLKRNDWKIKATIHLNPFQAADIIASKDEPEAYDSGFGGRETEVIDYQNTNDPVINNWFRSSPGDIQNADSIIRRKSDKSIFLRHREPIDNGRFWKNLEGLKFEKNYLVH